MCRRTARLRAVGAGSLIALALIWPACDGVDGEVSTTGCPEGETCAGSGLRFVGSVPRDVELAAFVNPRLYPTAVGGTQSFSFSGHTLDPRVVSANAGVLVVESALDDRFVVRGISEGSSAVRVETSDGALYDQITLSIADVDTVELRPLTQFASEDLRWAFFRDGGAVDVMFALRSAAGQRIVDDSATWVESEALADDLLHMTLPAEGEEVRVPVRLGSGELRDAIAPLVARVDRWVRTGLPTDLARTPRVSPSEGRRLCFLAMSGDRAIAAAPFVVTGEGPIAIGSPSHQESYGGSCVQIEADGSGDAVLVVRGGGAELRQAVRVDP